MKWWLISDEDVKTIRRGLTYTAQSIRGQALHALDTGLHVTACTPDDYKDDCWVVRFLSNLPENQRVELMQTVILIGDPLSQELLKKAIKD